MIKLPKDFLEGKMCIEVKNDNENSQFLKLCSAYTKIEESYYERLKLISYKSFERRIYVFDNLNPITLTIVSELEVEGAPTIIYWSQIIEEVRNESRFELKIELPNDFIEGLSMMEVSGLAKEDFINRCKQNNIDTNNIKLEESNYFAVESNKLILLTKEEAKYNNKEYLSDIHDWNNTIREQLKELKNKVINDFIQGAIAIKVSCKMFDDFESVCESADVLCVNGKLTAFYSDDVFIVQKSDESSCFKYHLRPISSKVALDDNTILGIVDWDSMFNIEIYDKEMNNTIDNKTNYEEELDEVIDEYE